MKQLNLLIAKTSKHRHQLFLGGFAILGVVLVWNTFVVINQNYSLQLRVDELRQEISSLEIQNQNLELQNQFLETDEFLERAARQQLGLAKEGETIYLEENAVLNELRTPVKVSQISQETPSSEQTWQDNLKAWAEFIF